jgi:protein-L-isoaspartate O-methyltransferase
VINTAPSSWSELVEDLAEQGVLAQPWRAAFLTVPREVFIPEVIWRRG